MKSLKASEYLEKTLALLDNDGWCQRSGWSLKGNKMQYCIIGAKLEVARSEMVQVWTSIAATTVLYENAKCQDIAVWNDNPNRKFEEVRNLFETSIKQLKERGD